MKIINLEKRVGRFVLQIDHLEIEEGCIHGLIGGNGSGKTTLMKLIMGILSPDSGHIEYEGLNMREITMTSQRPYLLHDTVYENIVYPLKIRGIRPDREKIGAYLESCGMAGKERQAARSLSSGEQQKVSMIRALCFHPRFVMIDETLSNLDPDSVEFFEKQILRTREIEGNTWMLISHSLSHIARLCDRVHVFCKGKVVQSGPAREVLFHSEVPEVQHFLGGEILSESALDRRNE